VEDYGIGLLRKGGAASLRQAEAAFAEVEKLGPATARSTSRALPCARATRRCPHGPRARGEGEDSAPPWTITWFTGLVNSRTAGSTPRDRRLQGGDSAPVRRGAQARVRLSARTTARFGESARPCSNAPKMERGLQAHARRELLLREAAQWFEKALVLDSEDLAAHYNLALIATALGDEPRAERHASFTRATNPTTTRATPRSRTTLAQSGRQPRGRGGGHLPPAREGRLRGATSARSSPSRSRCDRSPGRRSWSTPTTGASAGIPHLSAVGDWRGRCGGIHRLLRRCAAPRQAAPVREAVLQAPLAAGCAAGRRARSAVP